MSNEEFSKNNVRKKPVELKSIMVTHLSFYHFTTAYTENLPRVSQRKAETYFLQLTPACNSLIKLSVTLWFKIIARKL